jgi:hypothetical protein
MDFNGPVMTTITDEDLELLKDLERRGGTARVSEGRPRHGADRLVSMGYAASRALNLSDVEYEITEAGRKVLDAAT